MVLARKFFVLTMFLVFLAACGDSEETDNSVEEDQINNITEETNDTEANEENSEVNTEEADNQSDDESEEVTFEVESPGPEDQGDMNVWFEGEIEIFSDKAIAKGTTNLLPDSSITLSPEPMEGTFMFSWDEMRIDQSGEFELEASIPGDYKGVLDLEMDFEVGEQSDEVKEHYQDKLTGDFAQVYYDSGDEKTYKEAAFKTTVVVDGTEQTVPITKPEWDIPEDMGSTNIWIEPTMEKFEDYVVVKIKSNIVEEAEIQGRALIPNYITTGFQDSAIVNPDGTAVLYIKDPEKDSRIKNLEEYDIRLQMDPGYRSSTSPNVVEDYGANGEKLEGDYIVDTDEGKKFEQKLNIKVK